MARRHGRRSNTSRSFDWIQNNESYNRGNYTVVAGAGGKLALPLVYTRQWQTQLGRGGSVAPNQAAAWAVNDYQSAVAYPQGGERRVHRVRGWIVMNPSTWAVGNTTYVGLRLMKFEMTPDTGQALIDPDYTMWTAGASQSAYVFADEKNYFERRIFHAFSDNKPIVSTFIDVNYGQRGVELAGDEGFWIYTETDTGSISTRMSFWLRALVSVDG